ncbi:MAG: hypothetical protein HOY78_20365 [Saccharothrix sp.]|nr:hypothetical protein [Saccharothrix sp.]
MSHPAAWSPTGRVPRAGSAGPLESVLGLAFGADDRLAVLDAHGATVIELR